MEKHDGSGCDKECETLFKLAQAEELAAKKAGIYSRLLTDTALSEDMEALALRHEQRKEMLENFREGADEGKQTRNYAE